MPAVRLVVPSKDAQKRVTDYIDTLYTYSNRFTEYKLKMEAVDVAYARYKSNVDPVTGVSRGQGIDAATTPVGVFGASSTTPPVVVSEVDSMVAYLADVYLSGYPIFPVVSTPSNADKAEQLETLLNDHARIGGYNRQLLLFFRDAVKYNFAAVEADWTAISQYSIMDEILTPGAQTISKTSSSYTRLKRIDPYQLICDPNVLIGDISSDGDYAGYTEVYSRMRLKRFLQKISDEGKGFNIKEALESEPYSSHCSSMRYQLHPQVSSYVSTRRPSDDFSWVTYLTGKSEEKVLRSNSYELTTMYCRITPADFGLSSPAPNTVQIWKFQIVNSKILVQAERIISAYDYLPILFGQPLEDGLGYQTQSIAESQIPIQQAADTCFNISFNGARRAVQDRALVDPDMVSLSAVNAPVPAAKIPVKTNSLDPNKSIRDAYIPIPFDPRGTEGALDSGMRMVAFGKELSGLNAPMRGQFQKGNKSVQEWNDTMGGADARLRLPALTLEEQFFRPLKEILKLNIYQYGSDVELASQKTGKLVSVNIQEIRNQVLAFQIADGYSPKSKLAGTDAIAGAMQILSQSPILQQAYGAMLPQMFTHLMKLQGIKGLEEYTPQPSQPSPETSTVPQPPQGASPETLT